MSEFMLKGIDGGNPLGFLSAIGTLVAISKLIPNVTMRWRFDGKWRPILGNCDCADNDINGFVDKVETGLSHTNIDIIGSGLKYSGVPYGTKGKTEHKFPFDPNRFSEWICETQSNYILQQHMQKSEKEKWVCNAQHNSFISDMLVGFGSESYPDEEVFQGTKLRMIRSGDSAKKGLLYYTQENLKNLQNNKERLRAALFETWDYKDNNVKTLRFDPIEDRRYALRARNPSNSDNNDKQQMLAPQCLAFEAFGMFPTMIVKKHLQTTGFVRFDKKICFVWPIWTYNVGVRTIRSLLSLDTKKMNAVKLNMMGIEVLYRSEYIASSKYYHNFAQAEQFIPENSRKIH